MLMSKNKPVMLEETEAPEYARMQKLIGAAFQAAVSVFGCTTCAERHLSRMNWLQATAKEFDPKGTALPRADGATYECAVCLADAAKPDPVQLDELIPF
jgi:hypothetical protein